MNVNSIRFKASILYSSILAIILIIFSTTIYCTIRYILYQDIDDELRVKVNEIVSIINAYHDIEVNRNHPLESLMDAIRVHSGAKSQEEIINDLWRAQFDVLNLKHDYINLVDIDGRSILHSSNLSSQLSKLMRQQIKGVTEGTTYSSLAYEGLPLRVVTVPLRYKTARFFIQVATPLTHVVHILRGVVIMTVVSIFIILFLTSFMGSFFARSILRPVMAVTEAAESITHRDLSVRIKLEEVDEEMKRLVNSFNTMIERLERSFKHINEFSSHVAHELKTPLAIVKGEIELALSKERTVPEYKDVLRNCLEETDRMIRIMGDLLLLARLDYQPGILKFEQLNMKEFLEELYEHTCVLASSKNISVEFVPLENDTFIMGDKVHLRRLFLNLINNAIKFTSSGGKIGIRGEREDSYVKVTISDTGEGIEQKYISKIFDKFFRLNKGSDEDSGAGLGLSIALSIARAHKGDIKVESYPGKGSKFTVILPVTSVSLVRK